MELKQFIDYNRRAVSANFKARNQKVTSPKRMDHIKKQRRTTIRRFIAQIRVSTGKSTCGIIAEKVAFVTG